MVTAKETIIEAFLQLLFEKSFEELTVKLLIQKAGISRSTFYLHFSDMHELLEEVRQKLNTAFQPIIRQIPFHGTVRLRSIYAGIFLIAQRDIPSDL